MQDSKQHGSDDGAVSTFLQKLERQLGTMPVTEKSRIREEIAAHLEQIIASRIESGNDHQSATEAAIRQIGDPVEIGRKMRQEWALAAQRGPSISGIVEANIWALASVATATFVVQTLLSPHHANIGSHSRFMLQIPFVAPILTGVITGLRRAGQAVSSVIYMTGLWYVLFVSLWVGEDAILLFKPGAHLWPNIGERGGSIGSVLLGFATFALFFIILTLMIIVPAYLASAYKRHEFYRVSLGDFRLRNRKVAN